MLAERRKLVQKWSAHPYTIIGISECGNVYVKDICGKAHKRSLPPSQPKPYKDPDYISCDEDTALNCTNTVYAIKNFCHQEFPLTTVSLSSITTAILHLKHNKYNIDLNMPFIKMPIEVLDEIEEN